MIYKQSISLEGALHSVGEGWAPLIEQFYAEADKLKTTIAVAQVKEKFGALRIYFDVVQFDLGPNEGDEVELFIDAKEVNDLYKFVEVLEASSVVTCEACGNVGKLRNTKGWYVTLCNTCFEQGH
jgi:hypothetical protein